MSLSELNPVEPPWYVTRMPGGVGGVALRGAPLSRSTSTDSEARQEIAVKIQERAFETLPYIPTGQWSPVTAYRTNIKASSSPRHCSCGTSRRPETTDSAWNLAFC